LALRRPFARADAGAAHGSPPCAEARVVAARRFFGRAGSVAVEFALVAPIFFLFTLMIFEIGLDLLTLELMDDAVHDAARLMRIGTLTGSSYGTTLTTDVCNIVITIPSCSSTVQIYVAAAASGATAGSGFAGLADATVSSGTMTTTKATLASNYDVLLEIGYNRPWAVGWLSVITGESNTFLTTAFVFQTEPY